MTASEAPLAGVRVDRRVMPHGKYGCILADPPWALAMAGQQRPVDVHVFASQQEGAVVANLRRKEADARAMSDALAAETLEAVRENILGRTKDTNPYHATARMRVPSFLEAA